jgi:iron complex outermembrane receptor protein
MICRSALVLSAAAAAAAAALAPSAAHAGGAPTAAGTRAALTPVIVTASPLAGAPDRFASIVEVVGRDAIVEQGAANLGDSLVAVPGVSSSGFAAGAGRPVIRGMDANRVKILEDGLSSSDVSDIGPDHGVPIDPLAAQRIEVVRGAATLRYGSQAIGGVVNVINNRVPAALPAAPLSSEATAAYGAGAAAGEGSLLVDGAAGRFAYHADGFVRRTGDYGIPGGRQANSFFRGGGYSLGGAYVAEDGSHAGLAVVHSQSQYGIPSDTSYIDLRQTKLMSKGSLKLKAGPLTAIDFDAGYADYRHDEDQPGGATLSTFRNREGDGRIEALVDAFGPLSGAAVGAQLQDRRFSAAGEDSAYLFPTHTRSAAAFAFAEAPFGARLHLQAAGRLEAVQIDGTPASDVFTRRSFRPMSASLGAVFDAADSLKLGLTVTSAARAPAQTELFARGGHDGPQTFETGDPGLRIERANSVEATARAAWGPARLQGAVWRAAYRNYIYGRLTGRTCDDDGVCSANGDGDLRELDYDQRNADFWGAEVKADLPLIRSSGGTLSANLLGDYVRAAFANGGGDVPRIPPYRIGVGLAWKSDRFDAGFLALGVARQAHVGAGDSPAPGYGVLNAQAAWRPFADSRGFELALVGKNLTNSVERDAVALNKDAVVMPGRDVRLVMRASF